MFKMLRSDSIYLDQAPPKRMEVQKPPHSCRTRFAGPSPFLLQKNSFDLACDMIKGQHLTRKPHDN